MSTTAFRIQGTQEQFAEFERRCQVTEAMFARTLCQRFEIPLTDENLQLVAGWLSSARSMGIANHLDCGIQMERVDLNAQQEVSLHDVAWTHLGSTNQFDDLKKAVAHVCRDVTKAACIDELCINDILQTFQKHGYEVKKA